MARAKWLFGARGPACTSPTFRQLALKPGRRMAGQINLSCLPRVHTLSCHQAVQARHAQQRCGLQMDLRYISREALGLLLGLSAASPPPEALPLLLDVRRPDERALFGSIPGTHQALDWRSWIGLQQGNTAREESMSGLRIAPLPAQSCRAWSVSEAGMVCTVPAVSVLRCAKPRSEKPKRVTQACNVENAAPDNVSLKPITALS